MNCGIITSLAHACNKTLPGCTLRSKKVVHQAHIDNLVNSQRIFKILSLAHSAENSRYIVTMPISNNVPDCKGTSSHEAVLHQATRRFPLTVYFR